MSPFLPDWGSPVPCRLPLASVAGLGLARVIGAEKRIFQSKESPRRAMRSAFMTHIGSKAELL
eukprot:23333-Amphidinium_carterae.1